MSPAVPIDGLVITWHTPSSHGRLGDAPEDWDRALADVAHPDHRAVGRSLLDAVRDAAGERMGTPLAATFEIIG